MSVSATDSRTNDHEVAEMPCGYRYQLGHLGPMDFSIHTIYNDQALGSYHAAVHDDAELLLIFNLEPRGISISKKLDLSFSYGQLLCRWRDKRH